MLQKQNKMNHPIQSYIDGDIYSSSPIIFVNHECVGETLQIHLKLLMAKMTMLGLASEAKNPSEMEL